MLSLESLLAASKSIHRLPESTVPPWTLRQLVPVHEGLCQSMTMMHVGENNHVQVVEGSSSFPTDMTTYDNMENLTLKELVDQRWAVLFHLSDTDRTICHDVLQSGSDETKLLVLQYLLWCLLRLRLQQKQKQMDSAETEMDANDIDACPLGGLNAIVMPVLFGTTSSQVSQELRLALLDAVFATTSDVDYHLKSSASSQPSASFNPMKENNHNVLLLQSCLDHCRNVVPPTHGDDDDSVDDPLALHEQQTSPGVLHVKSVSCWISVCQVLIRLFHHYNNASRVDENSLGAEMVLEAIKDKILESLDRSVTADDTRLSPLLRPVTEDFLPLLLQHFATENNNNRQTPLLANGSVVSKQIDQVWTKLQTMINTVISENAEKQIEDEVKGNHATFKKGTLDDRQRRIFLVVTTVLCSILPSVVHCEMPVVTDKISKVGNDIEQHQLSATSDRSLPVYQACVWTLILTCLRQQQQQQGQRQKRTAGNTSRTHIAHDTLLRRRGIFLLRVLVEAAAVAASNETSSKAAHPPDAACVALMTSTWSKYVACAETLEMESEVHLVDQVWPAVRDLCAHAHYPRQGEKDDDVGQSVLMPPALTWSWIRILLTRALQPDDTTPVMRKLCLYRFLKGQAGICMTPKTSVASNSKTQTHKQTTKKKGRDPTNHSVGGNVAAFPLEMISTDFVLGVVVPSFDILHQSVGTTINIEEDAKVQGQNMVPMLESFLQNYLLACRNDSAKLYNFTCMLFGNAVVGRLRSRALVIIYNSIAAALTQEQNRVVIPTNDAMLQTLVDSFHLLLQNTSVVVKHREELLRAIATILSSSSVMEGSKINPQLLLQVLAMFALSLSPRLEISGDGSMVELNEPLWSDPTYLALQKWLLDCQGRNGDNWASSVGTTCAAAFVDGALLPSGKWDPTSGASQLERQTGLAIALLCTLSSGANKTSDNDATASQMLWPAIHKGMSIATKTVELAKQSQTKPEDSTAGRVARALILLEYGCQFRVLSGMGNGNLLVDGGTQHMMPPPPSIESLLHGAVSFLLYCVQALVAYDPEREQVRGGSLTSKEASRVSSTFVTLIHQVRRLHGAFPSSMAVSTAVQSILEGSLTGLTSDLATPEDMLRHATLSYALLSCGAGLETNLVTVELCKKILHLKWTDDGRQERMISLDEQTARSVFHLSRWGSLSCILPVAIEMLQNEPNTSKSKAFLTDFLDVASDSVDATPPHSLVALFRCVRLAGQQFLAVDYTDDDEIIYVDYMEKIIGALFSFLEDSAGSRDSMYMLNEICALLFQHELLVDECKRLRRNNKGKAPIRDAFRRLLTMAGSQRPHISRTTLSWITVAWLGPDNTEQGVCAILYREDILKLLVHKEAIIDELSANQSVGRTDRKDSKTNGVMQDPTSTDELSITRSFVLVFLSKLPHSEAISPDVTTNLVHFLVEGVIDIVSTVIPKGKMVMKGSSEYSLQMRGWQALCILSRFVNGAIVPHVCEKSFDCLTDCLHGQIRYFMENFTIQIARKHPGIVGDKLLERLRRRDLTLQEVSSILIITGNLVVGRYKANFIQVLEPEVAKQRLREVLTYSIPWLSSTQGFSRAIAQLLVHHLISQVIDVKSDVSRGGLDSDSILRSIYMYLEENAEMSRLRRKQMNFFERYDADAVCSPDFILKIPIDEGNEANPLHLVEAIKMCLQEIYEDSHSQSIPSWRQVEALLEPQQDQNTSGNDCKQSNLVNFQRKIIPIDAVNLLLEDTRERRLRNSVGRRKQQLIVCASLVDKVPNLGGLARTAEIFAADRLVVPDINMTHMDNFKTLCVGADEWIQIEECREEVR